MAAADPILFSILEEAARLIGLIRAGDEKGEGTQGYFFNWNPCNTFDAVGKADGPNADFFIQLEEPQDEGNGNNGGLYDNLADFTIEVQFRYESAPSNPIWQAQKDLMKCQEDLKRFFEHKRDALSGKGLFDIWRPKNIKPHIEYFQEVTNPGKLIMPWRLQYSQSRTAPELVG